MIVNSIVPEDWDKSAIEAAEVEIGRFLQGRGGELVARRLEIEGRRMMEQVQAARLLSRPEDLEKAIQAQGRREAFGEISGPLLGFGKVLEDAKAKLAGGKRKGE